MDLPQTIVLDVPNLLVLASVVVAILAAVYSGKAAHAAQRQAQAAEAALKESVAQSELTRAALGEAKRQNRIAGHAHRLEAYKELLSFRGQLTAKGIDLKREAVWALWEHAEIAEFYFSKSTADSLVAIVDAGIELQRSRDEWKEDSTFPESQRRTAVEATYTLMHKLREDVEATQKIMRGELRLVDVED